MEFQRKPDWLKSKLTSEAAYTSVLRSIQDRGLHTICTSGKCPNLSECWSKGTATIMILGDICTRSCKFCNTLTGKPLPTDRNEPLKVAEAIRNLGLKHAVITSVDRDDLPDYGASHWAETIRQVKALNPATTIEVLIPDFNACGKCIDLIIDEKPEIISHNMETVKRLTPQIRTKARYGTSLEVLSYISSRNVTAKTGIMLGLGETETEIYELFDDVLSTGCRIITIGQYMQPSRKNVPVVSYIQPELFDKYKLIALEKGFRIAESGPLVRSSYCAEKHLI